MPGGKIQSPGFVPRTSDAPFDGISGNAPPRLQDMIS